MPTYYLLMTKLLFLYLIYVSAFLVNGKAVADTFEVIPNIYHFNYEEFSTTGTSLNNEKGFLPGIKLKFSHITDNYIFTPYISIHDGKIDYTGSTQTGQPHTTQTEENLTQLGIEIKTAYIEAISGRVVFGARHWEWDRNILDNNNVRGLHEIYTWNEFSIGLNFETEIENNSHYWANISALHTFNPSMDLFLVTTKETFELGSKAGFRINAGKSWIYNKNTRYSLSIISEYWEFGKSDFVFTNDFFGQPALLNEPASESLHIGLEFSFIYSF